MTINLIIWAIGIPIFAVLYGAIQRSMPDEFQFAAYAALLFWPIALPLLAVIGVGYSFTRLGMWLVRPREPKTKPMKIAGESDHPFLVNGNRVDIALCAAATSSYRKGVRIHVTGLLVDEHTRLVQDERTVVVIEEQ